MSLKFDEPSLAAEMARKHKRGKDDRKKDMAKKEPVASILSRLFRRKS